ncbi:hypothetical protein SBD_0355 [Streptomyces bottropensis ATCC 25435]|uniref:Uncharacterized protein n=1 Tax=Streptomyces bottropensis ATCC 25435 TaxID=1054862 RepID=M3FZI6_9ACTN|nr:hypothetical protein SBD_0355 [Streptomyces bottropensis ATCC 25435]
MGIAHVRPVPRLGCPGTPHGRLVRGAAGVPVIRTASAGRGR